MYEDSLDGLDDITDGNLSSDSSPRSSDASSMDHYMKKLFFACDKDGDGYLDRFDLEEVSKQLGLEGDVAEILQQFGAGESGKIAYTDFMEFKAQFTTEMDRGANVSSSESANEAAYEHTTAKQPMTSKQNTREELLSSRVDGARTKTTQGNTISRNKESNITRPPDKMTKASRLQRATSLSEYLDPQTLQHLESLQVISPAAAIGREQPKGTDFLEIANRLHIAALSSLKNEIYDLNSRLHHVTTERDNLRRQANQLNASKQKMQRDFEDKLQSQMMRVTELQSVIAELTRKLNHTTDNVIAEEEDDGDAADGENSPGTSDLEVEGSRGCCSECSCDGCEHRVDGPNQLNLLATINDARPLQNDNDNGSVNGHDVNQPSVANDSFDLGVEVSRVLGQLECRVSDRRKTDDGIDGGPVAAHEQRERGDSRAEADDNRRHSDVFPGKAVAERRRVFTGRDTDVDELTSRVTDLEHDKANLERQLQKSNGSDYVSRGRSASTPLNEELNVMRVERENMRLKMRKQEQELEDVKAANLAIREDREKLRKKIRSLERKSSTASPHPSTTPTLSSAHVRYPSQAGSVDYSSTSSPSSSRKNSLQHVMPPQGTASFRTSASSPFVPVKGAGSASGSSPNSTLRRSGTFPVTSDLGSSVCGEDTHAGYSAVLGRCIRGRVPDTLFQTLTTYSKLERVLNALQDHYEAELSERVREKALERERATCQLDHLKSQNDLLLLCLEESKSNCERLSSLMGKYESNNTALSLALQSTDELTEAYEVMLQLQESEQDLFVANCQAAGITNFTNVDTMKSLASTRSSRSNASAASSATSNLQYQLTYSDDLPNCEEDGANTFRNSAVKRRDAEIHAKLLLQKLDRRYENQITRVSNTLNDAKSNSQHMWDEDETSYKSRTSTASSANSSTVDELSKEEELKLKDYIQVLKCERHTVETTVTAVETAQDVVEVIDDYSIDYDEKNRERYIEMETAVLVQELQAKKEERAELKHRVYLLDKEKKSLEVRLNAHEAQEHAYIVHIEHLKGEVKEQIRKRKQFMAEVSKRYAAASGQEDDLCGPFSSATLDSRDDSVSSDSQEGSRRENKLKSRIQELVETLEKLTKNSEIRQHQTGEYIADLKRANGALVGAYEKAKKRHAARLKKFEAQLLVMSERHQGQISTLRERIITLEGQKPTSTETSL